MESGISYHFRVQYARGEQEFAFSGGWLWKSAFRIAMRKSFGKDRITRDDFPVQIHAWNLIEGRDFQLVEM